MSLLDSRRGFGSPVERRSRDMHTVRSFVGMDVHKETISVSVAEDGRSGPVRFIGVIPNTPEVVGKMAKQLAKHGELDFCYEASGCGYNIHRQQLDEIRDVAALRLDPNYTLPNGPEFYYMRRSVPLMKWDEKELDELSLLMVGFPIVNSREVTTEGNRKFMFMGIAEHLSNYSADLIRIFGRKLNRSFHGTRTSHSPTTGTRRNIRPDGFSGCGVWVLGETPTAPGWTPDPIMIGIVHNKVRKLGIFSR
jgi:hypothetical protein